jgi:FtsP/CotA-like multicopper oxidase with cupredoxin domain
MSRSLICLLGCVSLLIPNSLRASQTGSAPPANGRLIAANDNRNPAGVAANGVVTIKLVAQLGDWQPEGPQGRTLRVQAFREEGRPLTIPSPLIRVAAGTQVQASIRNDIAGSTLRVFGMRERPATTVDAGLEVPAGETREVRFAAGQPGTYHYWATTSGRPFGQRRNVESQLGGAFVVDPIGGRPNDRVFVIGVWTQLPSDQSGAPAFDLGTINGLTWPYSEKLDYRIGDTVRWRVVNLSYIQHAMHLHGIYFKVVARGDTQVARAFTPTDQPMAVTQVVSAGETFDMEWTPERVGNWLFHCHMVTHMSPIPDASGHAVHHEGDDASAGMAGLVMGIRVSGEPAATKAVTTPPRRFTVRMREEPSRYGTRPGYRVDVEGIEAPRVVSGPVPGPVILLTRGEPVEAALVNEMSDPTAVHWHGIELDSYFDGVPGWGTSGGSITPPIGPGQTFTAKFTPPRAGTFIYHTHWHDEAQLAGGLYGPLIVLERGQRYDPATDHVFIMGYDGLAVPGQREPLALNGRSLPVPAPAPGPYTMSLRQGVANRLRLINVTPDNVALNFMLTDGFRTVNWKPVAKDGADLPSTQTAAREARQLVSVGETYDFEIQPSAGQRLWLEVLRGNGEWVSQALLVAGP